MVKRYCDACDGLIPAGEMFTVEIQHAESGLGTARYEVCRECCRKLAELIDQAGKPEKPEAEEEPEAEEVDPMDWGRAKANLDMTMDLYRRLLDPATGFFGLSIMTQLERRYNNGERTRELYDEMINLE